MIGFALCDQCKHKIGLKDGWCVTCSAFPDGIPARFHGSREECKNGVCFELKEDVPDYIRETWDKIR